MMPKSIINEPEMRKLNLSKLRFKLLLEFFTKFTIPITDSGKTNDQNNNEILDSDELMKPFSLSISKNVY